VKTAKVRGGSISYGRARDVARGKLHVQVADPVTDVSKRALAGAPVAVTAYYIEGRPEQLIVYFDVTHSTVKWREKKQRFIGTKAGKIQGLSPSSKNSYRAYKISASIGRNEVTSKYPNEWNNPLRETQPNSQLAKLLGEERARIKAFGESTKAEFLERARRARALLKGSESHVLAGPSGKSRKA